jgi:uncharacterized protein YmfQ (DUF2313 family)
MASCIGTCIMPVRTRQWMYCWEVASAYGDVDPQLEAAFRALLPRHTTLRFIYESAPLITGVLEDGFI